MPNPDLTETLLKYYRDMLRLEGENAVRDSLSFRRVLLRQDVSRSRLSKAAYDVAMSTLDQVESQLLFTRPSESRPPTAPVPPPDQRPLWVRIMDDLQGPSLDELAEHPEGIPDDVNPWEALGFDPRDHLPLWFPRHVNGRLLSPQQRLRWFEELLSRYAPGWNEWTPGEDPSLNKQEIATALYRILHDWRFGILPDPNPPEVTAEALRALEASNSPCRGVPDAEESTTEGEVSLDHANAIDATPMPTQTWRERLETLKWVAGAVLIVLALPLYYVVWQKGTKNWSSFWRALTAPDTESLAEDAETFRRTARMLRKGRWSVEADGGWAKYGKLFVIFPNSDPYADEEDQEDLWFQSSDWSPGVARLSCAVGLKYGDLEGTCDEGKGEVRPVGRLVNVCEWQVALESLSGLTLHGSRVLDADRSDPACLRQYGAKPMRFAWTLQEK